MDEHYINRIRIILRSNLPQKTTEEKIVAICNAFGNKERFRITKQCMQIVEETDYILWKREALDRLRTMLNKAKKKT